MYSGGAIVVISFLSTQVTYITTSRMPNHQPPSSPKQKQHHRHRHHHHNNRTPQRQQAIKRPDAVIFPPDPQETGPEVVDRIYRSFGLTDQFPVECLDFVNSLLEKDPCSDTSASNLIDYTKAPFITIDNDNSMDLDQAMWICYTNEIHENGIFPSASKVAESDGSPKYILVSYAVADGAYFVPALSPLFQFALRKGGSSFYLPGKSIPMLPRQLSENVMSLNEGVKRRALIFDMYLNAADGSTAKTNYCWGVIQSRWKGSYREVDEYYHACDVKDIQQHAFTDPTCEFTETLDLLRKVGQMRRQLAAQRDVVDYNRGESSYVTLSGDGKQLIFSKSVRYMTELYNEQISLLCNSEGANILFQMDEEEEASSGTGEDGEENNKDIVHPIFRVQNGPREEQVKVLEAVIMNTLKANGIDDIRWSWNKEKTPIGPYLATLRAHQQQLKQKTGINSEEDRRWTSALCVIERQAMITNVAASFSATPEDGHHSLKMTHYARFSSPMRELVGCFTHKELWEGHTGSFSSVRLTSQSDIALRNKVIRAARRSKAMQKKLSGALFLHMLNVTFYKELKERRLNRRTVYKGILMGMDFSEKRNKSRRCYVRLEDPTIEVKVFGEDLDYHFGCRYGPKGETYGRRGSAVAIAPKPGSLADDAEDDEMPPTFQAGQRVTIRVADYAQFYGQTSRSRWIFIMNLDEEEVPEGEMTKTDYEEAPKRISRTSLLRNSVVDRDLMQDLLMTEEEDASDDVSSVELE